MVVHSHLLMTPRAGWGEAPEPEASPHLVAEVDIEASDGSSTPEPQTSQEVEVVQEARNDEEVPSEQDAPQAS